MGTLASLVLSGDTDTLFRACEGAKKSVSPFILVEIPGLTFVAASKCGKLNETLRTFVVSSTIRT